jgi:hypothetical protein
MTFVRMEMTGGLKHSDVHLYMSLLQPTLHTIKVMKIDVVASHNFKRVNTLAI